MLASPLLLRASGSIWAARELFLCALFFNFTWLSYNLGGIGAPTANWLITGPLVVRWRSSGVPVSAELLYDYPTVRLLAGYIDEQGAQVEEGAGATTLPAGSASG